MSETEARRTSWPIQAAGPLVLFALLVIAKVFVVMPETFGPVVFNDELLYKQFAESLWHLRFYASSQYPPLYSAVLAPAFAFGEHFYAAMLGINVLVSSAVVFPAYAIARLLLSRRASLMCAAVIAVLPFHVVFPRSLLSENLYFPLLLLAFYLVLLEVRKGRIWLDVATGVVLGCLYLTRHISLVIIPPLLLAWWLKPLDGDGGRLGFSRRKVLHLAALLGAAFIAYAPWIVANLSAGNGLGGTLGFGIAATTNPEQLTFARMAKIAACYLAYFVLLAAPVTSFVFAAPVLSIKRGLRTAYGRLTIAVYGAAAAVFVAVVRHSWRAFYNYPEFAKLMGRYPLHFTGLFVILAFVTALGPLAAVFARRPLPRSRLTAAAALGAVSAAAVWFAWRLIISRSLIPLSATISDRGAVDGYRLQLIGEAGLWVAIGLGLVLLGLLVSGRVKLLAWVMTVGLMLYFLWGVGAYLDVLRSHQGLARLARESAQLATAEYPAGVTVTVPSSLVTGSARTNRLARGMRFWGLDEVAVDEPYYELGAAPDEAHLEVVTFGSGAGLSRVAGLVASYEYAGTVYGFIQIAPR